MDFGELTVDENLATGAFTNRSNHKESYERVMHLFPRLAERKDQLAGYMSGGEQQMLAIGRALMSGPELLIMDEPSLGLAPLLVQQVRDVIKEINASGTSILLIEQNAMMALSIANTGYVMENGKIVMENRKVLTMDEDKAIEDAQRLAVKLCDEALDDFMSRDSYIVKELKKGLY